MGFTNTAQIQELFLSCGMGFLLGAYYDVYRVLRRVLRPGTVRVFCQDILFFVTAALMTFLFALAVTDGVLRIYLLVGLVAGFFAYRYTVGRAVVRFVVATIALLECWGRRLRAVVMAYPIAFCDRLRKNVEKNAKKLKKNKKRT